MTAMDDEFEGLQPGSTSNIARASTIPQTTQNPQHLQRHQLPQQLPQQQQQQQQAQDVPSATGPQQDGKMKAGPFAKSFERFLENAPSTSRGQTPFDEDEDDDDDDMVSR